MRQEDCVDVFNRVPAPIHAQMNLVLKNGAVLAIDTVIRFEPHYVLIRGREGGTTDEGRSFFVPYEDIAYIKIERIMRTNDLKRLYGEATAAGDVDVLNDGNEESKNAKKETEAMPVDVMTPSPVQSAPMDPAAIAKQNLLDRIRSARTSTLSGSGSGSRPAQK